MIDDLMVEAKTLDRINEIIKNKKIEKVSFEFLVGSCFPKAMQNIKEEMRRQYTLGYTEGLKEKEKTSE